ncbi:MAG: FAD:protein FMN transferase [Acidimicrobiales bacterium]
MTADAMARRVMGTTAHVMLNGGSLTPEDVVDELDRLESCWTRFRADSELNRLNAAAGRITVVSPTLLTLVEHLVSASRLTGGRFDPTMRDQIAGLGYDRTYRQLPSDAPAAGETRPAERCDDIVVVSSTSTVLLPAGTALDPGGLGKGLAADLAADLAMSAGAHGVLVEIGGDIVTRGDAPGGGLWRIEIPAVGDRPEQIAELRDGAVATSDTDVRTWVRGGELHRHILDPATGRSLQRGLTATVVAGAGWWAEAVATAAIVSTARSDGWIEEFRDGRHGGDSVASVQVTEREPVDA